MIFRVAHKITRELCASSLFGDSQMTDIEPEMAVEVLLGSMEESKVVTMVISLDEGDLLESIIEILMFNAPRPDPLVRLVVISRLSTWRGSLFNNHTESIQDLFQQRAQCQENFEVAAIENALFTLNDSRKAKVQIALTGVLFGGKGYDHRDIFMAAWCNQLPPVPVSCANAVIPVANIEYASSLLYNIIIGGGEQFLNFLFDVHGTSMNSFVNDLILKTSSHLVEEQPMKPNIYEHLLANSMNIDWMRRFLNVNVIQEHPVLQSFPKVWNEFVSCNGLSPIRLAVCGPPKSGKSITAKAVSSIMRIPVVDLVGSVAFVFTHESKLYPDDLNSDHLEAVKQRIIASLEQKFAESLAGKKGKDKAAVDPKLDVSAITESFCSTIPVEILSEAIAFRSQVDTECRKKGYVIDCWEKDVFPSGDISTYQNFNKDRNSIPCQIAFQLQTEKQKILDKQLEIIGAQAAKSKDGQALIKTLETTLDSYYQSLKPEENGMLLDPTLRSWVNDHRVVVEPIGSQTEDLEKYIMTVVKSVYGFIPGWLDCIEEESSRPIEQLPENSAREEIIVNQDVFIKQSLEQSDDCVRKYNDYLAATVLGTLAKGLVTVSRESPQDPIKELARILYEASACNQKDTFDKAKATFEQLLQTS